MMGVAAAPALSIGVLAMLSGFCRFRNGTASQWTKHECGRFRGHDVTISVAGSWCPNGIGDKVEDDDGFEGLWEAAAVCCACNRSRCNRKTMYGTLVVALAIRIVVSLCESRGKGNQVDKWINQRRQS